MEIELTKDAKQDLDDIAAYLTRYFPEKSDSTYSAIEQACINLIELPEMGRAGKVKGTREVKCGRLPYRIIYRIKKNELEILRIYHHSRKPMQS